MSDFLNDNDLNELNELCGEVSNPESFKLELNDYTFTGAKKKVTQNGKELFEFNFRSQSGVFATITCFKNKENKWNFRDADRVLSFMASVYDIVETDRAKLVTQLIGKKVALKFKKTISADGREFENIATVARASDDMPF